MDLLRTSHMLDSMYDDVTILEQSQPPAAEKQVSHLQKPNHFETGLDVSFRMCISVCLESEWQLKTAPELSSSYTSSPHCSSVALEKTGRHERRLIVMNGLLQKMIRLFGFSSASYVQAVVMAIKDDSPNPKHNVYTNRMYDDEEQDIDILLETCPGFFEEELNN